MRLLTRSLLCVTLLPALLTGALAGALAGEPAEPPELTRFSYTELHMGVPARLVLYATDEAAAQTAARAAYNRVARLDDIFSDYRPDSEIGRLVAAPPGQAQPISPELAGLLAQALALSTHTDGAFDITLGPLIGLWRETRRSGQLPTPEMVQATQERVGWRHIHLDRRAGTVTLDRGGLALDFGAMAKGYAGDEALRVLREHGVSRALFEAGGDMVAGDPPPGRGGWQVAVPDFGDGALTVSLTNRGLSSSGDTEQYVDLNGQRYSHVVDARTGLGSTLRQQALVVAPTGAASDGLATALTLLDHEERAATLANYPDAVALVRRAVED